MFRLPATISPGHLVTSVEIISHASVLQKVERLLLLVLNKLVTAPRPAPAPTPWIVFVTNEMLYIGTLELHEIELALKYEIGLGYLGLPLDVYRRPAENTSLTILEADDEQSDVEYVYEANSTIDLTRTTDEEAPAGRRKRKRKRASKSAAKRRRVVDNESTEEELEFWVDEEANRNDENNNDVTFTGVVPLKHAPSLTSCKPEQRAHRRVTNLRIGIFCPRPYRSRLMNGIMSAMDSLPPWELYPQFKRNGYSLDTMWFLAANDYSACWMISTVESISKEPGWRQVSLLVEPWNNKFVVKNVLQLMLPWKFYRGNKKGNVVQRLRKANVIHGSNRWNLIGCKMSKHKIQVTLAVNEQTIQSLKRTQFYVFYGFSQYRCKIIRTASM